MVNMKYALVASLTTVYLKSTIASYRRGDSQHLPFHYP